MLHLCCTRGCLRRAAGLGTSTHAEFDAIKTKTWPHLITHRLPVSDDYHAEDSEFTGTVESVLIELAEAADDFRHLIDPQLRLSVAIARQ